MAVKDFNKIIVNAVDYADLKVFCVALFRAMKKGKLFMFRSAAALGMDAVLVTPSCCDPLIRRAARVSMGTVFQIPWTYIGSKPADWPGAGMARLRALGFQTAAMALRHDTVPVSDPRLKAAEKLAVILGTEGTGLTEETIRLSDYTVKIPMHHGVDSLNVAAASAIAFWETRPLSGGAGNGAG